MNLPKDGTKPLDKDGFDWIALNVIFQDQKGINLSLCSHFDTYCLFIISRSAEGPGREILQCPPSVRLSVCPSACPSVTFSFRTVTQKRIDVFSRNFAGTCTMSWGSAVYFLILMECCLNFLWILAPPAEKQRSFSNADSSFVVVCRRRQLFTLNMNFSKTAW